MKYAVGDVKTKHKASVGNEYEYMNNGITVLCYACRCDSGRNPECDRERNTNRESAAAV